MFSQSIPFLTSIDTRAAIKGSRDPLGFQAVWSRLGRLVVGNLTTITTSVRDFTVLLTGLHLTERIRSKDNPLVGFLIFEQIAAYARWQVLNDKSFRGVERVGRRLLEDNRVTLGLADECQILSNQKTYGLWGLYLNPARASGLVAGDSTALTEHAAAMIEQELFPVMESRGTRVLPALLERMAKDGSRLRVSEDGPDRDVLFAVAEILKKIRPRQHRLFREHLLMGGPKGALGSTAGCQVLLAQLLEKTQNNREWRLSHQELLRLANEARRGSDPNGEALAHRLDQIRTVEALLGMLAVIFDRLLQNKGQSVDEFATDIKRCWGRTPPALLDLAALRLNEHYLRSKPEDEDSGRRMLTMAEHLHSGDYAAAVLELVHLNAQVMSSRGSGGAWVDLLQGVITVRYQENSAPYMPDESELRDYWRHSYFIGSLREIAMGLQGKP